MIVCFRARGAAFRAALYHQSSLLGDIDETHTTPQQQEWMIFILLLFLSADRLSLLLLLLLL
jgi:hypothetical protein